LKKINLLAISLLMIQLAKAQLIYDGDGNGYGTVVIGKQVWMNSNLTTTHFLNGDLIPTTLTPAQDITLETNPIYQWVYDGNSGLDSIYGRLYTWYAATDGRGVCPAGWHLPSRAEFDTLEVFLGGQSVAGGKLKETGFTHWHEPNTGATNETGFNGRPCGHRNMIGQFNGMGYVSDMWTSSESTSGAPDFDLNYDTTATSSYVDPKGFGFAIRCVRDKPVENLLHAITIYPVPANEYLIVDCKDAYHIQYEFISLDGRIVLSGYFLAGINQLELTNFTPGVYIIRLKDSFTTLEYKIVIV
jgi:uncharacterized protein (TIGR02145 family)